MSPSTPGIRSQRSRPAFSGPARGTSRPLTAASACRTTPSAPRGRGTPVRPRIRPPPPPPPLPVAYPACDERDVTVVRDPPGVLRPRPRRLLVPPLRPACASTPSHRRSTPPPSPTPQLPNPRRPPPPVPRILWETHPFWVHSAVPVFEIDPGVLIPGVAAAVGGRRTAGMPAEWRFGPSCLCRPGTCRRFFPFSAWPDRPESGSAGVRHRNRPDRPAQKKRRVGNRIRGDVPHPVSLMQKMMVV